MDPLIEKHRDEILALAEKNGLTEVRVFGSRARGEAHADSDIDLLVTRKPGSDSLAIFGLEIDIEERLGCPADVATEGCIRPKYRERILSEAVPL